MTTQRTLSAPAGPFHATVSPPGDKSLSHRALIFSAMAAGTSTVTNLGPGQDVVSTRTVLRALGITIEGDRIQSPGIDAWSEPGEPLDCGNSGTTMRILSGPLAGRPFATTLTGDVSLRTRPMARLVDPIGALGGSVSLTDDSTAPITIGPVGSLVAAGVEIPMASAQVRTAFELAAIQADGVSTITSPPGYRDHSERWLATFGLGERMSSETFRIFPGLIPPNSYAVPGDPSSAAFLWAAAAIRPGSVVRTDGISLNPGRLGFLQILEQMGAGIDAEVTRSLFGDPVGNVTVRGRGLVGTAVTGSMVAAALDELPLVAVLGSFGEGITHVAGAAELRGKESDRIKATCEMIRALGGGAEESSDGFDIVGLGWLEPGEVASYGDHRIAMAAAVAATGATGPVTIRGADAAAVSWPSFYDDLEQLWSSR